MHNHKNLIKHSEKYIMVMTQIDLIKNLVNQNLDHKKYYTDLFVFSVVDRALKLNRGFEALIDTKNIQCTWIISRAQIDNLARLHGMSLDPERASEYVKIFLDPSQKLTSFKFEKNKKMSDYYLVQMLDKTYPKRRILDNYKEFCAYAHLSEKHFLGAILSKENYNDYIEFNLSFSEDDITIDPITYCNAQKYQVEILLVLMEELEKYFLNREKLHQEYVVFNTIEEI